MTATGPPRRVCDEQAPHRPPAVAGRTVAVLGTGTMGAPIARNLLRAGMHVRVWNRTPAKAEGLAADGALVATSPAAAAADIDVLITMLTDGAAVEQVMTGPHGALSTLGRRPSPSPSPWAWTRTCSCPPSQAAHWRRRTPPTKPPPCSTPTSPPGSPATRRKRRHTRRRRRPPERTATPPHHRATGTLAPGHRVRPRPRRRRLHHHRHSRHRRRGSCRVRPP